MKISKRWFVALVLTSMLLITSMMGQVYINLESGAELRTSEDLKSLQLMAVDYNPEGEPVLQRDGDRHKIALGDWFPDTNKTYPAAFAIVNPEEKEFRISSIDLKGEEELGHVEVWVHRYRDKPSNPELVDVETEDEGDKMLYYQEGNAYEYPGDGWLLGEGTGYQEDEEGELTLDYANQTETGTATLENGTWMYDRDGPKEAVEGSSNFVWVEISVTPDYGASPGDYQGPIEIGVEAEFEPERGSEVEFMSAGRRQGSPVLYRTDEKSLRLTFEDMMAGTTVLIPDAFAIVNAADTPLNVTGVDVENEIEGMNMSVYAHGDPNRPANGTLASGINTDENASQIYPAVEDGWRLSNGLGYTEDGRLIYGNITSEETTTANRIGGRPDQRFYTWHYDEEADNTAVEGHSNFVWVEIAFEIPEDAGEETFETELTFQLSSE